MHLWEIENGKHQYHKVKHDVEYYVEDRTRQSDTTDIYGTPVIKKVAESYKSLQELRKATKLFESDISEEIKFLQKRYGTSEERIDPSLYNVAVLDIEIASGHRFSLNHIIKVRKDTVESMKFSDFEKLKTDEYEVYDEEKRAWVAYNKSCYYPTTEFPKPELAKYPINLITINFVNKGKIVTFGSDPYTGNSPFVKNYIHDSDETQLLQKFIQFWKKSKIDIAVAYNAPFDFGYILKRCENLGIDPNELSPVNRVEYKNPKRIKIHGITILDYIDLYKKFAFSPQPSYKLENVAMAEIGEGKTKYEGDIFSIWKTNWNLFVEYNIQDTVLVDKMDKKRKLIPLAIKMATESLVPVDRCMTTTLIVEGYILKNLHKQNKVMPDRNRHTSGDDDEEDDELEGAHVEAYPGFYKNLMSFDVESLYPHMVMMYNISPETKLSEDDIIGMDESEYIKTPVPGVYYKKNVKGILPMIVEMIFKERKMFKKKMFDAHESGNVEDHEYFDSMQHNRKILINCFHKDTKIMTVDGIKFVKDVKIGDYVWSINPKTRIAEKKKVLDTVARHHTENLVVFDNGFTKLRVTKNHDMLVTNIYGNIVKTEARQLLGSGFYHVVTHIGTGVQCFGRGFSNNQITEEPYDDMVYCVNVEDNHTVLVGETDKMIWCGNCVYGVMGAEAFHFYDIDNASVVTAGGRELIKHLSENVNNYLNNWLPSRISNFYPDIQNITIKRPKHPKAVVIDTDSVVGSTLIRTNLGELSIESIFDNYSFDATENAPNNFVANVRKLKALSVTKNLKLTENKITYIKKHLVEKEMFDFFGVELTADHSCMVIRNGQLIDVKPRDVKQGDFYIKLLDEFSFVSNEIKELPKSLGVKTVWVYDIEVEDVHNFFGNDILVHNSNYIDISDYYSQIAPSQDFIDFSNDFDQRILTPFFNKLVDIYCNKYNIPNKINFKREKIILKMFVQVKKKYVCQIVANEKEVYDHPKIKITGLETKKSDLPGFCKTGLNELIDVMFDGDMPNEDAMVEVVRKYQKIHKESPVETIAIPKGVKDYKKYDIDFSKGLKFIPATPIHNRASINHNYMVQKYKLPLREIDDGAKIKYLFVNENNELHQNVIAFDDEWPELFDQKFKIDRDELFTKTFLDISQRMFDALGFKKISLKQNKMGMFLKKDK